MTSALELQRYLLVAVLLGDDGLLSAEAHVRVGCLRALDAALLGDDEGEEGEEGDGADAGAAAVRTNPLLLSGLWFAQHDDAAPAGGGDDADGAAESIHGQRFR